MTEQEHKEVADKIEAIGMYCIDQMSKYTIAVTIINMISILAITWVLSK